MNRFTSSHFLVKSNQTKVLGTIRVVISLVKNYLHQVTNSNWSARHIKLTDLCDVFMRTFFFLFSLKKKNKISIQRYTIVFDYCREDTNNDSQEAAFSDENTPLSEAQATLNDFWPTITDEIKRIKTVDAKNQVLPLARIKKIMKLDEDVKMISAEAPLLFAKAAEVFIQELTLRAWVHTEDNKRRTLQRNDIAMAITKFDQFDFLIDIVPREEVKPVKKENETKPLVNCDQVQYYLQLAQQHQQALQGTNGLTAQQVQQPGTTIQMQGQNVTQPITLAAPQNILVTNTGTPTVVGGIQQGQQTQQIQLVQQIVTPNGEITHVPVCLI